MSDSRRYLMGRLLPPSVETTTPKPATAATTHPIELTTLVDAVDAEFPDDNPTRVTHRTLRLLGLHNRVSFTHAEARQFLDSLRTWRGGWRTDRIRNLQAQLTVPADSTSLLEPVLPKAPSVTDESSDNS